eukprot:2613589-Prymnesium_polylepis.2
MRRSTDGTSRTGCRRSAAASARKIHPISRIGSWCAACARACSLFCAFCAAPRSLADTAAAARDGRRAGSTLCAARRRPRRSSSSASSSRCR